ncbi:EamA family transporter [Variovorax ginsengisoli]|uniref:EamA family transporter n=1 Tax=Variovorax ginsengisoli TaxID=363844 RepID=A0ABT8SCK1_9BURK|nr:EamA family transporter [Variovorax ginsengisoli]MDN8617482.1 EamA family transporter [Variovorax ginsengisoli]MDO1536652.1 EamA family transporter [Variovorax ginsengisoli]
MKASISLGAPASSAPITGGDLFAALCVVVIWGMNFVAMKVALHDFTPFQLGAIRYVFAALPLVLFIKRPQLPVSWLICYGFVQGVGQFGLLFVALESGMTAALASVLMQTQLFFTTILGAVLLHERIGSSLRVGLALAAAGLACFAFNFFGGKAAGDVTLLGLTLNLCAAAMWGVLNIITRKAQHAFPSYDALQLVVWASLVPIVPFIALGLLFDPPASRWQWMHAGSGAWVSAAYLGWIATILAYTTWTGLFKRHPANRVAPFSLGVPLVGLVAGIGLLGETITPWQWAGIGFVVAALATVLLGRGALRIFIR